MGSVAGKVFRAIVPADPRRVGDEPDYRFTLANERTFLAWIRTSLALAAGGLAVMQLLPDLPGREVLSIGLLALALLTAASSYRRWAMAEEAMRLDVPLPATRLPMLLTGGTALMAVIGAVLVIVDQMG